MNKVLTGVVIVTILLVGAILTIVVMAAGGAPAPRTQPAVTTATFDASPTPAIPDGGGATDWVSKLRVAAHAKGIKWRIFCSFIDDSFGGWAVQPGAPFEPYAEDGGKAYWYERADTQQAVAQRLYYAIQKSPNSELMHRAPERTHKQCPEELHGD